MRMADLSELARQLQEQVDAITTYLAREKLPPPSIVPTEENPLNLSIARFPSEVEKARAKARALSWNINQLLTPPIQQIQAVSWFVCSLFALLTAVLRQRSDENRSGEENRPHDPN
jgi:hypothetical protein